MVNICLILIFHVDAHFQEPIFGVDSSIFAQTMEIQWLPLAASFNVAVNLTKLMIMC